MKCTLVLIAIWSIMQTGQSASLTESIPPKETPLEQPSTQPPGSGGVELTHTIGDYTGLHIHLGDTLESAPGNLREIAVYDALLRDHGDTNCVGRLVAKALGDYGYVEGQYVLLGDSCYSKASVLAALPCVIKKTDFRTRCRGNLPGGNTDQWANAMHIPDFWTGPLPPTPGQPRHLPSSIYSPSNYRDYQLHYMYRKTLAKLVQNTGRYIGDQGDVYMRHAAESDGTRIYVETGVIRASLYTPQKFFHRNGPKCSVIYSAGFIGDKLTLDSNVCGKRDTVAFSARDLGVHDKDFKITALWGEPSLCQLAALTSACHVMRSSLSGADRLIVSNVTGFRIMDWRRSAIPTQLVDRNPQDTGEPIHVTVQGYLMGTGGVIDKTYEALVLDRYEKAWLELPSEPGKCRSMMVSPSKCGNVPMGAPRLGEYRELQSVTLFSSA